MADEIPQEDIKLDNEQPTESTQIDIGGLSDHKFGEKKEKPHLDGKECIVSDATLESTGDIKETKNPTLMKETVLFKVHYSIEGSEEVFYENYGGVSRLIPEGQEKLQPSLYHQGTNHGAVLFSKWMAKKSIAKAEDTSFKTFLTSLKNDKLKVRLKEVEARNPVTGVVGFKNIVESFV